MIKYLPKTEFIWGTEFNKALKIFKDQVINPILEKLNIDISRFIICPGNHDINRNADKHFHEIGLKSSFLKHLNPILNNDNLPLCCKTAVVKPISANLLRNFVFF